MRIVTQREITRQEFARYADKPPSNYGQDFLRRIVGMRDDLGKLDVEKATPEEVGEIRQRWGFPGIGDTLNCHECGKRQEALIRFGDEPSDDGQWQDLCVSCLAKGVALVGQPAMASRP